LTTSALSLFAARAKEVRVLVDGSKKRLTTVLPRNGGTFLMSLLRTSLKPDEVSRMRFISSGERSLMPKRCLEVNILTAKFENLESLYFIFNVYM
jgi:hypothetical protein